MDNFDSNTNNRFDFLQGLEMSDWIKKMLKDNFIEELGIELVNYDHNKIKLKMKAEERKKKREEQERLKQEEEMRKLEELTRPDTEETK